MKPQFLHQTGSKQEPSYKWGNKKGCATHAIGLVQGIISRFVASCIELRKSHFKHHLSRSCFVTF